jgi:uncharacterized damage-inducible protein DinB
MRLRMMAACCVMCMGSMMTVQAQMGAAAAKPAVGTAADPAKEIDGMLSLFEEQCMGVAKAMPADKYGFAPSAATFAAGQGAQFATVRTFAAQIQHLTQANYYFYSLVSGVKPDVNMKAIGAMTSKADLVAALANSFAFAHQAIATITPANAFLVIKGADGMNTRATLATFGVAHGFDHYGQMVEYLRMNGIVPPASAK